MAARSSTRPTRSTPLAAVLLAPLLLAACAATSGAAAPASSTAPTAMATLPAPPVKAPSASPGGPVEYALWVERQGFGGSSGLRQVLKSANWVNDNASWATVSDVETEMSYAERLAGWLDKHPATACWTDYHATVRATLDRVLAGFAAARDARAAGQRVPLEVGATLVSEAQSAFDLPAPAGC
jgi:hypothetical protein